MIKSVINVEAPRPHVFAILSDFARYKEWLPGCVESKVVSTSGRRVDTEVTISSVKTMTMGLQFEVQPDQFMNFKMTEGKDLKAYNGSWRLMDSADGTGTVVMGEMEMDAGAMVPKFMVSRMAKKSIDDTGEALRKRVRVVPPPAPKLVAPGQPLQPVTAPRRSKRILHLMKVPGGYRVWFMGETHFFREHSA